MVRKKNDWSPGFFLQTNQPKVYHEALKMPQRIEGVAIRFALMIQSRTKFYSGMMQMIHISCDRCKRSIDEQEVRYVLDIEARATLDPLEGDDDEERDHLIEIQEILERIDDADCQGIENELYQKKRFDLCPECFRQYMQNPFGVESSLQLDFSSN